MRRSYPSPALHFFVATAADASVAIMSYRPRLHGGRRSYCHRPQTGGNRDFVAGDTHFNEDVGPAHSGSSNHSGFQSPPFYHRHPPPSAYYQNQQYPPPPPYNQSFRPPPQPRPYDNQFRPPPQYGQQFPRSRPPFPGNLGFRPRPRKPLDYRVWEYAKTPPPPNSEKFSVLSYNILADYLATSHRVNLYFHIPRYMMDWEWRKRSLIFELGLWSADILCLQEVDRFHDLEEELKRQGYSGIWKMRTGDPIDGCAIFWRTSRFKLLHEESIEFNKYGLRNNVAQICVLELISQGSTENLTTTSTSSHGGNKLVLCNIHVLYNPRRGEMKVGQVRLLLDRAHAVSNSWNKAPVVVCGDFNCTPKSSLYNYISEQKLDISGVDRDKVSGQASAEIRRYRPDNPIPCVESVGSPVPSTADDKETSVKLNDSNPGMKIEKDPGSNAGSDSTAKEVSIAQYTNNSRDLTEKFPASGQETEVNNVLNIDAMAYPQLNVAVSNRVQSGSSTCVSTCNFEGSNKYHDNEDTPSGETYPEDSYSARTEAKQRENRNIPVEESMSGSSSEVSIELESLNHESSSATSVDGKGSINARRNLRSIGITNKKLSSVCQTADAAVASPAGSSGGLSSQSVVNDGTSVSEFSEDIDITCVSTSTDPLIDKKMEPDEAGIDGGTVVEDESAFLSALQDPIDPLLSDFGQVRRSDIAESNNLSKESTPLQLQTASEEVLDNLSNNTDFETVNGDKAPYDPSSWTPDEIEMATGNADCIVVEHPLKLKSTYTEVEDFSGTRDSIGEPLVTSYNRRFLGTVDYIWRSEGLQTVRVLAPIPTHVMQHSQGFPTKKWGSDHIALASELAFTNEQEQSRIEE